MRIISKRKLREFWEKHPDAKDPLLDWRNVTRKAFWQNLADARECFRHADPVCDRTVFNINRRSGKMTVTAKTTANRPRARRRFDQRKYGRLLAQTAPAVIRNGTECRRVEGEISKLLRKGDNLTPEEERLLDLLSALVERYEQVCAASTEERDHALLFSTFQAASVEM